MTPPVALALIAHNQEVHLREAVQGVLSQSYAPLEILLSDDCSTDGTFQVMCEIARAYRGPHPVILNRNTTRKGIGGHINEVMRNTSAPLVVIAAGDDVSRADRVERVVEAWRIKGGGPCSIVSRVELMGLDGRRLGLSAEQPADPKWYDIREYAKRPGVKGCAQAWTRDLFARFGPLFEDLTFEDVAIPFRALLLGHIHYIPEPLVAYRMASGVSGHDRPRRLGADRMPMFLQRMIRAYDQMLRDLPNADGQHEELAVLLGRLRRGLVARRDFLVGRISLRQFVECSLGARLSLRTVSGDLVRRAFRMAAYASGREGA